MLVSAVGAFQWKGGYQEYFPDYSFQTGSEHDSYLGENFFETTKYRRHVNLKSIYSIHQTQLRSCMLFNY